MTTRTIAFLLLATLMLLPACEPKETSRPMPSPDPVEHLRGATVTVYPVLIRNYTQHHFDKTAAQQIAAGVAQIAQAQPTVADDTPPFAEPGINSPWGAPGVEKLLGAHLHDHPIQTRYAIAVGYVILDPGGPSRIDFFLTDSQGKVQSQFSINDQNDVFRQARPKTVEDCTKLVISTIQKRYEMLQRK